MYKFQKDFYADIRIEDRFLTHLTYKQQKLDNYHPKKEKRAFIRVFDGKMWYYTSTAQLDQIQKELDNLYAQATPCEDIEQNPVVKKFEVNVAKKMRFQDNSVRNISKKEKEEVISSYFNTTKSQYVQMETIMYIEKNFIYKFYSSKGADLEYDYQTVGILVSFNMASENDRFSSSFSKVATTFDEIVGLQDQVKKELAIAEDFLLNAVPCDKGDFPVVLAPVVAGVFAHESFGHKSEADFMIGDENAAKDWELGAQVGSPILSIYDSGVDIGSGYTPFDDEGTAARKNYLIKDGKLAGRLHSATTAVLMGEELTGNARAINCKYEPIVRMTSTVIEAGEDTLEQLIAGIKDGYFVYDLKHGSGLSKFTIAPNICYRIKEGKIDKPAKVSVLTGDVFETLGLVDGLSKSHEELSFITGGCGKMEQQGLPVGFGGPYVRISKINVQ